MNKKSDHILHFYFNRDYPVLTHGKGIYLYDVNHKEYIDGSSGAISSSLAYGRTDLAETLREQVAKLPYAFRHVTTTDILQTVGEKLNKKTGLDRFFLVSGGTLAVEIATKIARLNFYHSGRPTKIKIISRWQSYHGYSIDTLALGGHVARRQEYVPYLREDGHIPPAYCYRCWFGKNRDACDFECANALETEILMRGKDNVAAFIAETVSGASIPAAAPPIGYFKRIREICDQYDIYLILDEIMCGSGRTGKMLAIDHYGIKPDIVALAKSLGGGYFPVGAAACTEKILEPIKQYGSFSPGYTWAGNPMAAAIILKTLEIFEQEKLLDNVTAMGDVLKQGLNALKDSHPSIGDVRGIGLLQGVEFVKDKVTGTCFDPSFGFASKVVAASRERGLLINAATGLDKGQAGDGLLIGPNFEVKADEIHKILMILDESITNVENQAGIKA